MNTIKETTRRESLSSTLLIILFILLSLLISSSTQRHSWLLAQALRQWTPEAPHLYTLPQ